jgi:hypothetical protein
MTDAFVLFFNVLPLHLYIWFFFNMLCMSVFKILLSLLKMNDTKQCGVLKNIDGSEGLRL